MNIPRNKLSTCLIKCIEWKLWSGTFWQRGYTYFKCEKAVPTNGRMRLFAARFWLSGDF